MNTSLFYERDVIPQIGMSEVFARVSAHASKALFVIRSYIPESFPGFLKITVSPCLQFGCDLCGRIHAFD